MRTGGYGLPASFLTLFRKSFYSRPVKSPASGSMGISFWIIGRKVRRRILPGPCPPRGKSRAALTYEEANCPTMKIAIQTERRLSNGRKVGTHGEAAAAIDAEGRFEVKGIAAGPVHDSALLGRSATAVRGDPWGISVHAGETTALSIPVRRGVLVRGPGSEAGYESGLSAFPSHADLWAIGANQLDELHKFELETDKEGRFSAIVPAGAIELRLDSSRRDYADVYPWRNTEGHWDPRFIVPAGKESYDLEPIELVPADSISGKLVDLDRQPLNDGKWDVYGYPEIPGEDYHEVANSFGGTFADKEGRFSGVYPRTYPPVHWKVSHRRWPTPYQSVDDDWDAKIISRIPSFCKPVHGNQSPAAAPPAPSPPAPSSGHAAGEKPATTANVKAPTETVLQERPRGNCSISGKVVSASTGGPVSRARMHLSYEPTYASIFVNTADDGTFTFKDIPQGPISLQMSHTAGYQDAIYNPEGKPGEFPGFRFRTASTAPGSC